MTTGALIFAFNNEEIDYVSMAAWSAKNIRKHLGIPVAVVTDSAEHELLNRVFDQVILCQSKSGGSRYFEDYKKNVTWNNVARIDAYNLTPWDCTLVLDADYVVDSSALTTILKSTSDFMCHKNAYDMTATKTFNELNCFGKHKLPMWWATVMLFTKSNVAEYIFDCMHMIKNNWQHYRNLYGIQNSTYRNDYALSIAIGIVSGHSMYVDEIPWGLSSVSPDHELTFDGGQYRVKYNDAQNNLKYISFKGLDFHAMGKYHLGQIIEST